MSDLRALELVNAVGPITATSANHSGVEPLYDTKLAGQELGLEDDCIVEGDCLVEHQALFYLLKN